MIGSMTSDPHPKPECDYSGKMLSGQAVDKRASAFWKAFDSLLRLVQSLPQPDDVCNHKDLLQLICATLQLIYKRKTET